MSGGFMHSTGDTLTIDKAYCFVCGVEVDEMDDDARQLCESCEAWMPEWSAKLRARYSLKATLLRLMRQAADRWGR